MSIQDSMLNGDTSFPTMDELMDDQEAFVTKCVKLVASWYEYFSDNNQRHRDDTYFINIDQWSLQDRGSRNASRKPVLEINYLRPIMLQMLAEQRAQDPDPIVSPKNEKVSPQMVKLAKEIIKNTFYENNAPVVFQECFKYMITGGYSAVFHLIDYEPGTFNKKLKMFNIDDIGNCFFDPNARKKLKDDGRYCGFRTALARDTFKRMYPEAKTDQSFPAFRNDPNYYSYWFNKDYIYVCDMWIKLEYEGTIVRLSDGTDHLKPEADKLIEENKKRINNFRRLKNQGIVNMMQEPEPLTISMQRRDTCFKQFHVRMSYQEILELEEWDSAILPGVFGDCDSVIVNGRQRTISFFRASHDSQRYLNYLRSEAAETILNSHHLSWLGTPGNVKGNLIDYWKNPQQNKTILLANYDEKGNLPQPVQPPQISPAFETQAIQSINDIQNTVGRYEASMGKQGNEKSGVAIEKRGMSGAMSSFVPFDNLKQVMQQSANITLDLQPMVMEGETTIRVKSENNDYKFTKINQKVGDKIQNNAQDFKHVGVEINVGASYVVQKMANFQMFLDLMQLNPELSTILLDLAAENLDLDNINQVVQRIRDNVIPPAVLAKEAGQPPPPPTPEQQQMQQAKMAAMMEPVFKMKDAEAKNQLTQEELQLKKQEFMHSQKQDMFKNQIEQQRMQTEIAKAKMEAVENHHDHLLKAHELHIKNKQAEQPRSKLA